jgi:ABC-type glycerol-3-phosphate transport system permease component
MFFRITVPLSAAGIGLQGLFTFMGSWNDFMTPLIYLNKQIMYTLPISLMALQSAGFKITYGAPLAGAFISCLPVIAILSVVGQKYFVKGLLSGAVKG